MSDRARRPTARGVGSYDTGPRRAMLATAMPGEALPVAAEGTAPAAAALPSARAGSEALAGAARSARAGSEAPVPAIASASGAPALVTVPRTAAAFPVEATSSAPPVAAASLAHAAEPPASAGHGSWEDPTLVSRSLPAGEPALAQSGQGVLGSLVGPALPLRVISMKDGPDRPRSEEPRVPLHVQLRTIAEVAGIQDSQRGLGNPAPPRDPRQARARRMRDNLRWACIAIVLASGIAFAIWLVAGR